MPLGGMDCIVSSCEFTVSFNMCGYDNFMQATDHPNILRLLEIFEDEKNLFLVTELCGAGDLGRCAP